MVQAPLTNIGLAAKYNIIPTDITPSALMLEVHFYSPFNFCQMEKDEIWGYQAFYWGEGNYVEPDTKYGHGFLDAIRKTIKNV